MPIERTEWNATVDNVSVFMTSAYRLPPLSSRGFLVVSTSEGTDSRTRPLRVGVELPRRSLGTKRRHHKAIRPTSRRSSIRSLAI